MIAAFSIMVSLSFNYQLFIGETENETVAYNWSINCFWYMYCDI